MSDLKQCQFCGGPATHIKLNHVIGCVPCAIWVSEDRKDVWQRRTQPEATAPAQDQQLVVATSTETGFFHVVISLNDGKRMLVLYDKQHSLNGDTVGVADVPAAALASSANALSGAIDKDAKIAAQRARIMELEEQLARALDTPVNDWCPECHARESSGDALSAVDRVDALEEAAQACDQQADGTNGPYRTACLQCANAVRELRDAAAILQSQKDGHD